MRYRWMQETNGDWLLYRVRRDNGTELYRPRFVGYHIHTLGTTVVLIFPDGGTSSYHSITEAKAEAEKDIAKEVK